MYIFINIHKLCCITIFVFAIHLGLSAVLHVVSPVMLKYSEVVVLAVSMATIVQVIIQFLCMPVAGGLALTPKTLSFTDLSFSRGLF